MLIFYFIRDKIKQRYFKIKTFKHGLYIGIDRIDNDFFLSLKVIGKLTWRLKKGAHS